MKTNVLLKKLGIAGAVCGLSALVANATVVYNTTSTVGGVSGNPLVIGMDFVVNTEGNVTAMGVFDDSQNGFGGNVSVAIYRLSDGSIVAGTQTAFSPSASGTLVGDTRFQSITPVYLAPGTYSIVVANLGTTLDKAYYFNGNQNPSTTFDSVGGALSMVPTFRATAGSTLPALLPSASFTGPAGGPAWGAGSFDFTPVPEASDFAMAGMGLLAVVYIGRCAVLRRKLAV